MFQLFNKNKITIIKIIDTNNLTKLIYVLIFNKNKNSVIKTILTIENSLYTRVMNLFHSDTNPR